MWGLAGPGGGWWVRVGGRSAEGLLEELKIAQPGLGGVGTVQMWGWGKQLDFPRPGAVL